MYPLFRRNNFVRITFFVICHQAEYNTGIFIFRDFICRHMEEHRILCILLNSNCIRILRDLIFQPGAFGGAIVISILLIIALTRLVCPQIKACSRQKVVDIRAGLQP